MLYFNFELDPYTKRVQHKHYRGAVECADGDNTST